MNFLDAYRLGQKLIDECYNGREKDSIILSRFKVRKFTQRFNYYVDIVRKCQEIFNVLVYRSPSCIEEGLYVVGKKRCVEIYIKYVMKIIKQVEEDTNFYAGKNLKVFDSENKKRVVYDFALKRSNKFLYVIFDLEDYLKENLTTRQLADKCSDYILAEEFVQQINILKTKKRYYGKVRFVCTKSPGDKENL